MCAAQASGRPIQGRFPFYFLLDYSHDCHGSIGLWLDDIRHVMAWAVKHYDAQDGGADRCCFTVIGVGGTAFQAFPVVGGNAVAEVLAFASLDHIPCAGPADVPGALRLLIRSIGHELHNVGMAGDAQPVVFVLGRFMELAAEPELQDRAFRECQKVITLVPMNGSSRVWAEGACTRITAPRSTLDAVLEEHVRPVIESHRNDRQTQSFDPGYRLLSEAAGRDAAPGNNLTPPAELAGVEPYVVSLVAAGGSSVHVPISTPGVSRVQWGLVGTTGGQTAMPPAELAITVPALPPRTLLRGEIRLCGADRVVGVVPIIGWVSEPVAPPPPPPSKRYWVVLTAVVLLVCLGAPYLYRATPSKSTATTLTLLHEQDNAASELDPEGNLAASLKFSVHGAKEATGVELKCTGEVTVTGCGYTGETMPLEWKTFEKNVSPSNVLEVWFLKCPINKDAVDGPITMEGTISVECPSLELKTGPIRFKRTYRPVK